MAESIIVVGAGAAGLMAAKLLSAEGNTVTILEADTRLGGRMHTVAGEGFSQPIEAGAEFIHGDVPLTFELLKQANIEAVETGGKWYRSQNGKWVQREQGPGGWDEMMEKMARLEEDMALKPFLEKYFNGEKYAKLRARATGFAEGFDVADTARISVFMLRDEWGHEGPQYRIKGGYVQLANYLARECQAHGCNIVLDAAVRHIEWSESMVVVHAGKQTYTARKVIVTVPISLLQPTQAGAAIKFTPVLNGYSAAANDIGFGDVLKIVLEFKQAFWEQQAPSAGFIMSDEWVPVWWAQTPAPYKTLTGWLGGPRAATLKGTREDELLRRSLASLASIFNTPVSELDGMLIAGKAYNWAKQPYAMGAYSYATPQTKKALQTLTAPVAGTIYFAGEAIYDGPHPGTVEAALVNGQQAARHIIASK